MTDISDIIIKIDKCCFRGSTVFTTLQDDTFVYTVAKCDQGVQVFMTLVY